ncbi:MAG TPA: DUF1643 domain-containing protein [Novosphingobium sp.]|nr:DUF1643 domain-containing protein [Novosphingobium sp.]
MSTPAPPPAAQALPIIRDWATQRGLSFLGGTKAGAVLSPCGRYRYLLWREAGMAAPFMGFALLNPSTADATSNDATIRRCLSVMRRGIPGCGPLDGMLVWNLFALRARDPAELLEAENPIGPHNDAAIALAMALAGGTIAGWGQQGHFFQRDLTVRLACAKAGLQLHSLRRNRDGTPAHPLYLPGALIPMLWEFDW